MLGEAGCKDPQHLEDGADEEQRAEVACVGEAARERADEEDEEDLERADPAYVCWCRCGVWWVGGLEGEGVVGLEDAEGVDEAPCVHCY